MADKTPLGQMRTEPYIPFPQSMTPEEVRPRWDTERTYFGPEQGRISGDPRILTPPSQMTQEEMRPREDIQGVVPEGPSSEMPYKVQLPGGELGMQSGVYYPPALRRPSQASGPIKPPIPPGLQGPSNEQMLNRVVEPIRQKLFTYAPHHGGVR